MAAEDEGELVDVSKTVEDLQKELGKLRERGAAREEGRAVRRGRLRRRRGRHGLLALGRRQQLSPGPRRQPRVDLALDAEQARPPRRELPLPRWPVVALPPRPRRGDLARVLRQHGAPHDPAVRREHRRRGVGARGRDPLRERRREGQEAQGRETARPTGLGADDDRPAPRQHARRRLRGRLHRGRRQVQGQGREVEDGRLEARRPLRRSVGERLVIAAGQVVAALALP